MTINTPPLTSKPMETNNYRMFSYPKNIYSTTISGLADLWSSDVCGKMSEDEKRWRDHANDDWRYRHGRKDSESEYEGPNCFEYLLHYLACTIMTVIVIPIAFVVTAAAFIIGAIADGIEFLSNQFRSEAISPAP